MRRGKIAVGASVTRSRADALGFADESGTLRLTGSAGDPADVLLFDLPG